MFVKKSFQNIHFWTWPLEKLQKFSRIFQIILPLKIKNFTFFDVNKKEFANFMKKS